MAASAEGAAELNLASVSELEVCQVSSQEALDYLNSHPVTADGPWPLLVLASLRLVCLMATMASSAEEAAELNLASVSVPRLQE
jgi:hypothetical protein